uniref:Uncharacterized protein n=1 Tax=Arundo donax TaxID=35708 RepID=A0A0A9DH69_ARUDO
MMNNGLLDRNMRLYGLPLEISDINNVFRYILSLAHPNLITLLFDCIICEHHSMTLDT